MSDTEIKFLPCPYCGETEALSIITSDVQPDNLHSGYVHCSECDSQGASAIHAEGWLDSEEEAKQAAVEAWNKRVQTTVDESSLVAIASYIEPHWKGAGLSLHHDWMLRELKHRDEKNDDQADHLEKANETLQKVASEIERVQRIALGVNLSQSEVITLLEPILDLINKK